MSQSWCNHSLGSVQLWCKSTPLDTACKKKRVCEAQSKISCSHLTEHENVNAETDALVWGLLPAVTSRGWNSSLPSFTAVSTKQWISFSFDVIMIFCLGKTEKSQTTAVAKDKYKTGLKFGSSVKCPFNKAVFKILRCISLKLGLIHWNKANRMQEVRFDCIYRL